MTEFKIGDRVKIAEPGGSGYEDGATGYIVEDPDNYADNLERFCVKCPEYGHEQVFDACQLELVNE